MKITFYQSVLFALILFQTVTTVKPQLLSSISHAVDSVAEKNPPPTPDHAAPSDNKSGASSAPNPPPSSSSSSPEPSPPPPAAHSSSAPAAPAPKPTTINQQPPSSQQPAPPSPTHSSADKPADKPAAPHKPSDITTQPQPDKNENKPNPPTPNTNDKDKDSNKTPVPPDASSSSSSGVNDKAPKAPGSKPPPEQEDTSNTNHSVPSVTNGVNRSAAPSNNTTSESKIGTIVGAVVGSIFGVALIGGIIAWANRNGGCASRRSGNKRSSDFEDYGLADTDFPHSQLQSPQPMQSVGLATNAAAIGSATPVLGATSPTIPRVNDQGAYYGNVAEDPYATQYSPAYQSQMDSNGSSAVVRDYNSTNQQPYYYQHENVSAVQVPAGGYYDESGYYYERSNQHQQLASPNPTTGGYDMGDQYSNNHIQTSPGGDDSRYYKPDQRI